MSICEEHGIEHTALFPCGQYEKYLQLTAQANTVTEHETKPIEDPDREGLLGLEQVEVATHESGWTGNSEELPVNDDGWNRLR